jgi:tRNA pseudouridine55 synthase
VSINSKRPSAPCGVLNLNKPSGVTSRDVVDRVVRLVGKRVKVGHAGTLDPLASGVLVVCVGTATRLIEYVQRQTKTYRTVVRLGARSDTHDADGVVTAVVGASEPSPEAVRAALGLQVGTVLQKPPDYSALKVGGRRAYDLARAGLAVELALRPVSVYRVDVLSYQWPMLELEVECGGGTYIRSIARDLGEALGCGGLVEVLVRTRIGRFTLKEAVGVEDLAPGSLSGQLRPAAEAVSELPEIRLTEDQVADIAQGRPLVVPGAPTGEVALFGPLGTLVGVGEGEGSTGRVSPRRVLVGSV